MSPGTLTVTTEEADGIHVVVLNGPVDSATFEDFKAALHEACQHKGAKVLLDCDGLTYMNSKSFGLLSSYHRKMVIDMGTLALCNINRKIVKTMDLLGLGQMLKLYETRDDALAELRS